MSKAKFIARVYRNGRLAYYGLEGDDAGFWKSHWESTDWRAELNSARSGALGYFEEPFTQFLPREGRILEAGCGIGQIVIALRTRGYQAEGVEFSRETVSMVKDYQPDLPIHVDDVRNLHYPDGYFSAYISLGVMEHFPEGPEAILREAARVVNAKGILLVSVPRLSPMRQLKARMGIYSDEPTGHFYQYLFHEAEIFRMLKEASFSPLRTFYYSAFKGLKDEVPIFRHFFKRGKISHTSILRIDNNNFLLWLSSHMVLIVARKTT